MPHPLQLRKRIRQFLHQKHFTGAGCGRRSDAGPFVRVQSKDTDNLLNFKTDGLYFLSTSLLIWITELSQAHHGQVHTYTIFKADEKTLTTFATCV
jgi:hypothetical protein